MPRPVKPRTVCGLPTVTQFKPCGVPARALESVVLGLDELEAIRLADLNGLYQDEASARMGISRPTFARLLARSRGKVAEALLQGKALVFAGGSLALRAGVILACGDCGRREQTDGHREGQLECAGCGSRHMQVPAGAASETGTELATRVGTGGGRRRRGRECGGGGCRGRSERSDSQDVTPQDTRTGTK